MSVGIGKKDLVRTIRPNSQRQMGNTDCGEMLLPCRDVVDQQGVMIPPMVLDRRILRVANQVQLLVVSQPKPGARKRESRPSYGLKSQHVAVKSDAARDIADMDGDVIKLQRPHVRLS